MGDEIAPEIFVGPLEVTGEKINKAIAEVKKLGLSANHAGADEVRAAIEQAMTTLDQAGLAEVRNVALERYYQ